MEAYCVLIFLELRTLLPGCYDTLLSLDLLLPDEKSFLDLQQLNFSLPEVNVSMFSIREYQRSPFRVQDFHLLHAFVLKLSFFFMIVISF